MALQSRSTQLLQHPCRGRPSRREGVIGVGSDSFGCQSIAAPAHRRTAARPLEKVLGLLRAGTSGDGVLSGHELPRRLRPVEGEDGSLCLLHLLQRHGAALRADLRQQLRGNAAQTLPVLTTAGDIPPRPLGPLQKRNDNSRVLRGWMDHHCLHVDIPVHQAERAR